jgi:biotin transport system permease protein
MLTDLYVFGHSPLHRVRPVVKIGTLVLFCTILFVVEGWPSVLVAGGLLIVGFAAAGLKPKHAIALDPRCDLRRSGISD